MAIDIQTIIQSYLPTGPTGPTGVTGATGDSYWTPTGTAIYYTTGSVGVGLTGPTGALHVVGTTTLDGPTDLKTYLEVSASPSISANTLTLDLATATVFTVSLNANINTLTISNVSATANRSVTFVLIFTADGTPRSVTWPSPSFRWPSATAPTITSTNSKRDVFTFFSTDAGTTWNAFISGQNL